MENRTESEADGWSRGDFSEACTINRTKFSTEMFFLIKKNFQLTKPETKYSLFHVSMNWIISVYWNDVKFFFFI